MLQIKQELSGHTDRVWTLAWNPSGTILASSGADKTIRLWTEKNSGEWYCTSMLTEAHKKSIRRLCWSPCGNYLASASFDSSVCIWKRNEVDGSWSTVVNLDGHESEVKSIAWSNDGQYLASCGRDRTIWIWEKAANTADLDEDDETDEAENWDCSDVKNDHNKDVKHITWHPHHNILVSTSYDDTVKFFHKQGDDWTCFDTLLSHSSTVWSADFSASGQYLVTSSDDRTVRIWKNHAHDALPNVQANTWKCVSVMQGYHGRSIYDVSWNKNIDVIASASGDNSIVIYERENSDAQMKDTFCCVYKHNQAHKCDVNTIAWNPKIQNILASGGDDRSVVLWTYERNDLQGRSASTLVEEVTKNLSSLASESQAKSATGETGETSDEQSNLTTHMNFEVNSFSKLSEIIQNLQTIQSAIHIDRDEQRLSRLFDLKLSNFPALRLTGLLIDSETNHTKEFVVDLIDGDDNIKYRYKLIFSNEFDLRLPRRSTRMKLIAGELYLLEKTGDLYKIQSDGQSKFLLGHLFTFSDVQFVTNEDDSKLLYIISADRDEKIRITNYPNTFDIERYCFGHKHLVDRIFIANDRRFVSVDQQGDVCVWDLAFLESDKTAPLEPIETLSLSCETKRKRLCV